MMIHRLNRLQGNHMMDKGFGLQLLLVEIINRIHKMKEIGLLAKEGELIVIGILKGIVLVLPECGLLLIMCQA